MQHDEGVESCSTFIFACLSGEAGRGGGLSVGKDLTLVRAALAFQHCTAETDGLRLSPAQNLGCET